MLAGRPAFVYAAAGVRFCLGMGSSGADRALLQTLDIGWLATRFGALIIASGDGIFTEAATSAACSGVDVWQVSGRGGASGRLHATTHRRIGQVLGPQRNDVTTIPPVG